MFIILIKQKVLSHEVIIIFKKRFVFVLSMVMTFSAIFSPLSRAEFTLESPRAVLIDGDSGRILFEKNANEVCSATSLMKIMNALLTIEAIENGELEEHDNVTISDNASSIPGVNVWLKSGENASVKDLLKAISMVSANDAAMALAEHLSGSEGKFVSRMNEKAAELGMKNTIFKNAVGSDDDGNVTTAYDVALMSSELINHKSIIPYCATWIDHIRSGSTQLVNTNKLLKTYSGTTGIKTGTAEKSGSCIAATAEKNGIKLVGVILGAKTPDERFKEIKNMLDYGFSEFVKTSPPSEEIPQSIKVKNGMLQEVPIKAENLQPILMPKKNSQNISSKVSLSEEITAPVQAGQKVGEVTYSQNDNVLYVCNITTTDSVNEINFKDVFSNMMKTFLKR